MKLEKIISGAQTGADRAGLNVAIQLGLPHGGWVPKGRRAEDGKVPDCYQVKEHESSEYPPRTEANILDSDGTVVFTRGVPETGSGLTIRICERKKKPWLHIDVDCLSDTAASKMIYQWLNEHKIKVLNVAGNRESKSPGIGAKVERVLLHVFLVRGSAPIKL